MEKIFIINNLQQAQFNKKYEEMNIQNNNLIQENVTLIKKKQIIIKIIIIYQILIKNYKITIEKEKKI